jgi:hypothetical protein
MGTLVGVQRQEFESDWAFAKYLLDRLRRVVERDLPPHVDQLFHMMEEARRSTATGPDPVQADDALYAAAF